MSIKCCFLRCKILGLKIRACKKLDKYHVWPPGIPYTYSLAPWDTPDVPLESWSSGTLWTSPMIPRGLPTRPLFSFKEWYTCKKKFGPTPPLPIVFICTFVCKPFVKKWQKLAKSRVNSALFVCGILENRWQFLELSAGCSHYKCLTRHFAANIVDCPTQLICTLIFICCCVPWQS